MEHSVPMFSTKTLRHGHEAVCRLWHGSVVQYEETARRSLILSLLLLIPAVGFLRPVIGDADIWWHLRTGQWIAEHGTLPTADPYSTYGAGKPWVAYSWLFELLIYGLYEAFDVYGILAYQFFGTMAVAIVVYWFISRREPRFGVSAALAAVAVVAICRDFTPRPWLFTIVFFTITMDAILSLRNGTETKAVWGLPALYVIWANVHIQFIYGLLLLILACLAPMADIVCGRSDDRQDARSPGSHRLRRLVTLTAACLLATLLNPHHVHLYRIIFELGGQTGMYQYTQELQAPSFRTFADWVFLGLSFMAAVRLGRIRRLSSFECLVFIVAAFFAFRSMRDAWFLVLAALAVHSIAVKGASKSGAFSLTPARSAVIGLFILIGTLGTIAVRDFSREHIAAETAKIYPTAAAAFVEARAYEGPLYNHFDWGGYLIWRLPHLAVSMDGRANVHGDERIWRSLRTWNGGPDWSSDPELKAARGVIAKRDAALTALLRGDPRFKLVFEDQTAAVFISVTNAS